MKAVEQYFPVVLFVMLYKVVLTFEPLDHIQLEFDHSNDSYLAVLCSVSAWFQLSFACANEIIKCYNAMQKIDLSKKLLISTVIWCYLFSCTRCL